MAEKIIFIISVSEPYIGQHKWIGWLDSEYILLEGEDKEDIIEQLKEIYSESRKDTEVVEGLKDDEDSKKYAGGYFSINKIAELRSLRVQTQEEKVYILLGSERYLWERVKKHSLIDEPIYI